MKKVCSVDGCNANSYCIGLCTGHHSRFRRHGVTQPEIPLRGFGKICSISGCDLPHRGKGFCRSHLYRFESYGDPLGGAPIGAYGQKDCSISGCDRPHTSLGFCKSHYRRFKKYGDPLAGAPIGGHKRGVCSIPDCDLLHNSFGYCKGHYARFKLHGDPLSGAPIGGRKRGVCSIPGCDQIHQALGFCVRHYQQFKKYGDPLAKTPNRSDKTHPFICLMLTQTVRTAKRIADIFDTTEATISNISFKYKIKRRKVYGYRARENQYNRQISLDDEHYICLMLQQTCKTCSEIGELFDVREGTIKNIISRNKVKNRPKNFQFKPFPDFKMKLPRSDYPFLFLLNQQGRNLKWIGDLYNVNMSLIHQIFSKSSSDYIKYQKKLGSCVISNCTKPVHSYGLCGFHISQKLHSSYIRNRLKSQFGNDIVINEDTILFKREQLQMHRELKNLKEGEENGST